METSTKTTIAGHRTRHIPHAPHTLLAIVLAICLAVPSTAFAAEGDNAPATEPSTSSQATSSGGEATSAPAEGPAPSEKAPGQAAPETKPAKKALKVTGLCTSFSRSPKSTIKDGIRVSPAGKHKVVLQMLSPASGKWVTKARFTTKKDGRVTLTYPKTWSKRNSTKWRIVISATDKYERYASKTVRVATRNRSAVKLKAKSALIMDAATGQTFYGKYENTKRHNASTTKMMTALLALENNKLDDPVTLTKHMVSTPYSYLEEKSIGETTTVKNLLYMALLPSDNGAARALAIKTAGSEKKFAALMNKRARELGCKNTKFVNPHGLTAKGHGSSARDLALIAREALKNPTFAKIVRTKRYAFTTSGGTRYSLTSTDKLLGKVSGMQGVKTGFTDEAGYCFVGAVKHKGRTYLTVVMGCPSEAQRWTDTKALIRYIRKWF